MSVFESRRKNSAIRTTWYLPRSINLPLMVGPYEPDFPFASLTMRVTIFRLTSSD